MQPARRGFIFGFILPAALCVAFVALHFYLVWLAELAVADTIRQFGRNVDSGQMETFVAWYYVSPAAAMFGLAAALHLLSPRWARRARVFAWVFVLAGPVTVLAIELRRLGV